MDTTAGPTKEEKKKLSKAELLVQKKRDQVSQEATRVSELLGNKFFDFFIHCDDPDSEEVQNKINQLHGQWMLFCKKKNLTPENYILIKSYCGFIVSEYRKEKDGQPEVEEKKEVLPEPELIRPKPEEPPSA